MVDATVTPEDRHVVWCTCTRSSRIKHYEIINFEFQASTLMNVDPVDTDLVTNVAAANSSMQVSLKNLPNVVSSYILGKASVEIPYSPSLSRLAAIAGKTSNNER